MTVAAAIAVSTSMAFAQTSISGTVVSNDDEEPIIGASIRIDGTKTGTVTDINGNFSLIDPCHLAIADKALPLDYPSQRKSSLHVARTLSKSEPQSNNYSQS